MTAPFPTPPVSAPATRQLPTGLVALAIVVAFVRLPPLVIAALLTLYGWASQGGGVAEYEQVGLVSVIALSLLSIVGLLMVSWQFLSAVMQRGAGLLRAGAAIALADIAAFIWIIGFAADRPPAILVAIFAIFVAQVALVRWTASALGNGGAKAEASAAHPPVS